MGIFEAIRRAAAGQDRSYVYHGFSVQLPPDVHRIVHDESLPEHVRGFHLARHLLTARPGDDIVHPGEQLGQDWHRDSYWASMAARASAGGVRHGRTPYVLKALAPSDQHVMTDPGQKGYPMWLHAGSPVHFTGLYWHHPEHQSPGSPHEGDEHELDFPEPVTARA